MTWYSNAATLEKRLHNQSWSTSYPLWAGGNPGPEIESCSIKKIFISSQYLFSLFPLDCLDLKWIWFLTRSFISPSALCSTLSFLKNMHLEHNAFNWWNLSTWYALWSEDSNHIFQSWQPTWKPLTLFLKDVRADVHGQLFCHVEENQLYTVWCWDVSRHSMLRYHKMKVENFIKAFKTETFLWHVPAHHYIILVNMVEKFLNTKTSWTFKKNHHLAHNVF